MSAPAMKDFSPAPVITTTPIPSSCSTAASAASASVRTCSFRAFILSGRVTVRIATRPSRSKRIVSAIGLPPCCLLFRCQACDRTVQPGEGSAVSKPRPARGSLISAVPPFRPPLLEVGGDPFAHVLELGQLLEIEALGGGQRLGERQVAAGGDGALDQPQHRRALASQLRGEARTAVVEAPGRQQALDQSELGGTSGGDRLGR